ncbi:hypothetical protein U1Q18_004462 [Sarracenia purpurea var. burkii]
MEQVAAIQGLPTDRNILSKLIALHPGLNNQMSNNHHMVCRGGGTLRGGGVQRQHHFLARQTGNGSNAASVATAGSINNMEGSIGIRSTPSRSNSFKAASNSDSYSAAVGRNDIFN